jgi:hypothetical protein
MADDYDDEGNKIEIKSIDELRDTRITIGCYRETHRLGRMVVVFQKALTLARRDGKDGELISQLVELHDHKGLLTIVWRDLGEGLKLKHFVELAWEDECEGECVHRDLQGKVLELTDEDSQPSKPRDLPPVA